MYLLCLRNLNFRLQDTSLDVYSLLFLFPFPIYFSCVALSGSVSNSYLYLKYELFGLGVGLFFFFTSFSILALGLPLQRELEFFFSNSLYHRLKMPKGNKLKPRWKESCMQLWVRSLAEKAPIVGLPNFSV